MPAAYKTPGVYVEEISTLPPSVAEVSTAIPAFLGYTEKASNTIARVSTLLEYEQIFGGPKSAAIEVTLAAGAVPDVKVTPSTHLLHHAIDHYFKNGGGACYIVSVGSFTDPRTADHFTAGLARLEKEDEPTLVVATDAIGLGATDYYEVCKAALAHCKKMGDRFAILDVKEAPDTATNNGANTDLSTRDFRTGIGTDALSYGAAYYPYVETTLKPFYTDTGVTVTDNRTSTKVVTTLDALRSTETALFQQLKTVIGSERLVLPPSAAMAGIYARVDRDRGVWKAPANVSLSAVIGPTTKINNTDQESLNVDPTGGKSINAIRAFTGKGTLVWGARTLAGNDNEWRYVPVRRLFVMIEESAQKSTGFAVFEPNDVGTWLKVKGMIESFLYGLWERGALAGSTPETAYFVEVGLGKTMTTQDILEGRMIVKIGVAAVRPAEFIVLQFSHKLQEA